MDVPSEILAKLKCSICDGYLSCSPIMLKTDGTSACGHCSSTLGREAMRNTTYETVAILLRFPCENLVYGCIESVTVNTSKAHRDACEFKPHFCPVSKQCQWLGPKKQLMEHCQTEHPNQVLEHPCIIQHEPNQNSLKTYLTNAFNLLFLIHTKVCLNSKKIYFNVRRFEKKEKPKAIFVYDLTVTGGTAGRLNRRGAVAPPGSFSIQEVTSVTIDLEEFYHHLITFAGTKFQLTLTHIQPFYKSPETQSVCKYHPCTFRDKIVKLKKHESLFCHVKNKCCVCNNSWDKNLLQHFQNEHPNLVQHIGKQFTANLDPNQLTLYLFVSNEFGCFIGSFRRMFNTFVFELCSNFLSMELDKYICFITLTNPETKQCIKELLKRSDDTGVDWHAKFEANEYFVDIQVDILLEFTTLRI